MAHDMLYKSMVLIDSHTICTLQYREQLRSEDYDSAHRRIHGVHGDQSETRLYYIQHERLYYLHSTVYSGLVRQPLQYGRAMSAAAPVESDDTAVHQGKIQIDGVLPRDASHVKLQPFSRLATVTALNFFSAVYSPTAPTTGLHWFRHVSPERLDG